ncbi:MAG: glycosyltransferase [Parasporobacterium sp.]|nr:glycosyltransferase [Parasporobacterium sp.]MBR3643445.1 glycosyltransferase [Parasporobacterium sp.]
MQFVDTFYPVIDGVARVVDNYAKNLNSYDDVDCCVFCPEIDKSYKDDFSYDVIRTKSLPLLADYRIPTPKLSNAPKVAFQERKPDLVHAHSPFTLGHYGLELAKKYKVPFVTSFHSKYYDDFLQRTGSKLLAKKLVDYIVRFYEQADSVWTVGVSTAETLRSYGYKGEITLMDNATTMIYPENPEENIKLLDKNWQLPRTGKNLLFVGRITKQKNLYFMLDTMRFIKDKDVKLIIVGDGTELKALKQYAEKTGISDKMVFIGQISDQNLLKSFYLESDLFFFPSTYDTSTLVAREAAALKVPTIMIRGCNSADLIVENQNGFLCEEDPKLAAAEIETILSSPDTLKKVGQTAADTIGTSWEKRMPEVLEKYREIIENYH